MTTEKSPEYRSLAKGNNPDLGTIIIRLDLCVRPQY